MMQTHAQRLGVPFSLYNRPLRLDHYPKVSGHPGSRKLYHTLLRQFYWPGLALICYSVIRSCRSVWKRTRKTGGKIHAAEYFPTLRRSQGRGNVPSEKKCPTNYGVSNILVKFDLFTNLYHAVPLKTTTVFEISKAFNRHWEFAYRISKSVLTDNSTQFNAKLLQKFSRVLGVEPQFTTTYHPKANKQT